MLDGYFGVVESFLAAYGIAAVFALGIVEEFLFFIPMSLLFVGAGFFLVNPQLNFWPALWVSFLEVGLLGGIGVLIGGLIVYSVAYWSGKKIVKKFGGYVGLNWQMIEDLNVKLRKGHLDEAVLFFLRAIPVLPIGVISIFCGLVRYDRWQFIWTTFVGSVIRLWGLAFLGWYLGREYVKYALQIAAYERYFFPVFLIIITISIIYQHRKYVRTQQD